MRQPSKNGLSFPYGATSYPYSKSNPHAGSDYGWFPNPAWSAPEKVKVTLTTKQGGDCGTLINFKSIDGHREYRGCHNQALLVRQGQTVAEGKPMGIMGTTGRASGRHLHLVMWVDGKRVNPYVTINKLIAKEDMYKGKSAKQHYQEAKEWKAKTLATRKLLEKCKKTSGKAVKDSLFAQVKKVFGR